MNTTKTKGRHPVQAPGQPQAPGKVCSKCGHWKFREEYHRQRIMSDGLRSECKLCAKMADKRGGKCHPAKPKGYGEFGPLPPYGTEACDAEIAHRRAIIDAERLVLELANQTGDGTDDTRFSDRGEPDVRTYRAYGDSVLLGGFRRMTQRERAELVRVA